MGRAQERSRDGRGPNRSYAGVNRIRFEGCILSPVAVPDRNRTPQSFKMSSSYAGVRRVCFRGSPRMGGSVVFSHAAPPGPATRNQGRGGEAGAGPIAEQPLVGIPRSAPALTFPLPPTRPRTGSGCSARAGPGPACSAHDGSGSARGWAGRAGAAGCAGAAAAVGGGAFADDGARQESRSESERRS